MGEIRRVKMLLIPSKEQELEFKQYVYYFRKAYNLGLEFSNYNYDIYDRHLTYNELSRMLTKYKHDNLDFYEIDSHTLKQAMRNVATAFKNYFSNKSSYPKFKGYKTARKSFYTRQDKLSVTSKSVKLSSLGTVKAKSCHWLLDSLLSDGNTRGTFKTYNPYIYYDNKHWFLSFGVDVSLSKEELTDIELGLDLGIVSTITTSEGKHYVNINRGKKIRKLQNRLKRYQRKLAKKYIKNVNKTKNIIKLENKIRLLYRKITNVQENHIHSILNDITDNLPNKIVIEDLDVKQLLRNKHLAKSIQEQKFYRLRQLLIEKCKNNFILIYKVPRYFASSKQCSKCKTINKQLKQSDRIFVCNVCNLKIDRDENAAINLRDCNHLELITS
ncbi:putative transposase [compost metagenome]